MKKEYLARDHRHVVLQERPGPLLKGSYIAHLAATLTRALEIEGLWLQIGPPFYRQATSPSPSNWCMNEDAPNCKHRLYYLDKQVIHEVAAFYDAYSSYEQWVFFFSLTAGPPSLPRHFIDIDLLVGASSTWIALIWVDADSNSLLIFYKDNDHGHRVAAALRVNGLLDDNIE